MACALVVGCGSVAIGLWKRVWFLVLFGIPWLSVTALLLLEKNEPLPVVDGPDGAESRVSSEHPLHLALFGLTTLSVGVLVLLPALAAEKRLWLSPSLAAVVVGGLLAVIGAGLLGQGLHVLWRRRAR